MKTPLFARGPTLLCLMSLCACTKAPLLPAPTITLNTCQAVSPCTLPAMAPSTNGDLDGALTIAKAAWATCAAKVDMIVMCQAREQVDDALAEQHHE